MTMVGPEPGSLPPGLVAYVAGGHDRVERAFSQTLTSLADRGWLVLTPEDTGASTAQLVGMPSRGELPKFEMLVLARVQACSRAMPTVPLSVLTDRSGDEYRAWSKGFTAALADAALKYGLTTRRMRRAFRYPVALLIAALAGTVGDLADSADRSGGATSSAFIAFIFGLVVAAGLSLPRLTYYGKQVAAWGRSQLDRGTPVVPKTWQPADAVPQDAVPTDGRSRPVLVMPLSAVPPPFASQSPAPQPPVPLSPAEFLVAKDGRPPPPGQAWSSYGGRWHLATVGPVEIPVRGRPRELAVAAYNAIFFSVPCALLGLLQIKGLDGAALAAGPAAVFALFGSLVWFPRYRRRIGITRRIVYRGQVVKLWLRSDPRNDEATSLRCCCVDDGQSEVARTFFLKPKTYKNLHVGDDVEVIYSPRWQLLRRIRRVR